MKLVERTSVRRALFALVLIPLLGGAVSIAFLAWITHSEAVASRDDAAEVRAMTTANLFVIDLSVEASLMRAWSSSPEVRSAEAGLVFGSWIGDQAESTDERWLRIGQGLDEFDPIVADGLTTTWGGLVEARRHFGAGEFEALRARLVSLEIDLDRFTSDLHLSMLQDGGLDRLPLVEITDLGTELGAQGASLTEVALTGSDGGSLEELVRLGDRVDSAFERVGRALEPDLRGRLLEIETSEGAEAFGSLRSFVRSGGRLDSSAPLSPELIGDLQLVGVFYEDLGDFTNSVFERSAERAEVAGDVAALRRDVLVGAGVAALLLFAGLAAGVAWALGRRIDLVAQVARRLSAGDLDVEPIDLPGDDEIAGLASTMDDMAGTLRRTDAQVRALASARTDDPALEVDLPGSIGRNLRTAMLRLGTTTAELKRQATHDALTGLLDRHGLDLVVGQLEVSSVGPVGVIVIDLDGFKDVNDRFGHAAGDVMLEALGRRLTIEAREDDVVARIGGDEFVLLVPGVDASQMERVADRLVATICKPVTTEHGPLLVGASVGWTLADPGTPIPEAIRRADDAMFEAKRSGKGRAVGAPAI